MGRGRRLPKTLPARIIIQALKDAGFSEITPKGKRGSHRKFGRVNRDGTREVTGFQVHSDSAQVPIGTYLACLQQAGLTEGWLRTWLYGPARREIAAAPEDEDPA